MNSNAPPQEALRALQKHRPFLTHAFAALETATELAREFFQQQGFQRDPHYFSHSVRYHFARLSLVPGLQQSAGYQLWVLPNTGLEVISRGDRIRIWRATEGEDGEGGMIPPPGDAIGRRDFVDQPNPPLFQEGLYAVQNTGKLVLLWDTDGNDALSLVRLACPFCYDSPWKVPLAHWNVPVPHPAAWPGAGTEDFGDHGPAFGLDFDESQDEQPN